MRVEVESMVAVEVEKDRASSGASDDNSESTGSSHRSSTCRPN